MVAAGTYPQPKPVSILLVNFRTPDLTLACLESIAKHCGDRHEIVVLDNCSGDDSLERLRASPVPFALVDNPVNAGFGAGCNAAAKAAHGEYLYLLNTDTLLSEDSPSILARFLEARPEAAAVGSRLLGPDGNVQLSAGYFPSLLRITAGRDKVANAVYRLWPALGRILMFYPLPELLQAPCRIDWCVGASLMIRAADYRTVGGFDETFFMYAEEIDLCHRLCERGEIWFTPETTVFHLDGGSSGDRVSDRRMAFIAAGHRRYYAKHNSRPVAWLYMAAECATALVKGGAWRMASWLGGGKSAGEKATWHLTYLKNYFRVSYPLATASAGSSP